MPRSANAVGCHLPLLRGSRFASENPMTVEPPVATAPRPSRTRQWLGAVAVLISAGAIVFWSIWGGVEAFYEGWYHHSLWQNLALTLAQYWAPALTLFVAAAVAVAWPRPGAVLHLAGAAAAALIFNTPAGRVLIAAPLASLALLYWFGRVRHRGRVVAALSAVMILTLAVAGAWPGYRATHRLDDGIRTARIVEGRDVRLRWAPAGPGWPERGASWFEATRICASLDREGTRLAEAPQNDWRLPTADEVVRSLTYRSENAGGSWDGRGAPQFRVMPEKESPLWDRYSLVVYWWTATEVDATRAWRLSYNGHIMETVKSARPAYYGFRCVTNP
jgi:hypothetical protein